MPQVALSEIFQSSAANIWGRRENERDGKEECTKLAIRYERLLYSSGEKEAEKNSKP